MSRLPSIPEEPGSSPPPYRSTQLHLLGELDMIEIKVDNYLDTPQLSPDWTMYMEVNNIGGKIAEEMNKSAKDDPANIHSINALNKCTEMSINILRKMDKMQTAGYSKHRTRHKRIHRKRTHRKRTHRR